MDRITSYISTISDYREKAKQAQNQSGQNWYDYFYAPLQESFKGDVESATKAIETAGNYDISSAYAQYLQSQRQLTSSNISSGDIARLSDSGYKAYEQAYQQSKYNIATQQQDAVGEISSAYDKLLTDEEKRIDTEASMMRDIAMLSGSFLQDMQSVFESVEAKTGQSTGLVGADLSKVVMGSPEQKELYAKINEFFNSDEEGYGTFADYILDKKGAKYFDFYAENQDKIWQAIGGLEFGEDGKTLKTARDYQSDIQKKYLNDITDINEKSFKQSKLNEGLTIKQTDELWQKEVDLKNTLSNAGYEGTANKLKTGAFDTMKFEYKGKTYKVSQIYNPGGGLSSDKINKKLGTLNLIKNGTLKNNDVIKYENDLYVLSYNAGVMQYFKLKKE